MAIPRETKDAKDAPDPVAGEQDFVIVAAKEETYSSGNLGLTCSLKVDNGALCFARNAYTEGMLWRLRHLCESIDLPMEPPPDARAFVGRRGRANFKIEKYQGRDQLAVIDFIKREGSAAVPAAPVKPDDADVPF